MGKIQWDALWSNCNKWVGAKFCLFLKKIETKTKSEEEYNRVTATRFLIVHI